MGQAVSGLRSILSFAPAYDLFQWLAGANRVRKEFTHRYVRAWPGARILDIGCGTAEILDYLPAVDYHGFDASQEYINAAVRRYAGRATFTCDTVTSKTLMGLVKVDLVLAIGILHHLDDAEAAVLLSFAKSALVPGGRLVTIDGCYVENQSRLARFILSRDRGQNIRWRHEYEGLARTVFDEIDSSVRHDLNNIPFTHLIMECRA